ncbi:hypothetical protein D3C87_405950 [compost metagenome]
MNKKSIKITYWITTIFVAFVGFAGIMNILQLPSLVKVNHELGLPQYLMPFLGTVKVLGAITILLQPLKRFHEAAYAGFVFYFTGASYVLIANGGGIDKYGVTLMIIAATVLSYLSSLKLKHAKE